MVPKLPDMWRVMKEVDLEAIRRDAERPFQIAILADDPEDRRKLSALLSGSQGEHPWIRSMDAEEARRAAGSATFELAVVVSRAAEPAPALASAAEMLRAAQVPVVTVVCGAARPLDALVRPGEGTRAAIADLDEERLPAVAQAVLAAVPPSARLALARQLPPLRPLLIKELIEEASKANAIYALTTGIAEAVPLLDVPLNLADIVVLTKNQLVMSYKIAVASGKSGSPRHMIGEVLGVVGGAFLFRQGARQLVGLIPIAGIAPKVVVAYAGTQAIGRAVAAWAGEGKRLSRATVQRLYREARGRGKHVADTLVSQAQRAKGRSWGKRTG
jgi:uncharacterized protein (DUF697 family)